MQNLKFIYKVKILNPFFNFKFYYRRRLFYKDFINFVSKTIKYYYLMFKINQKIKDLYIILINIYF